MTDRLGELLRDAAFGRFPEPDGALEIVGSPPGKADAVVAFTAHAIVAASLAPADVRAHVPTTDLGAPMDPRFLAWLATSLGAEPGVLDVVLAVVPGEFGEWPDELRIERRDDLAANPRVARALAHRTEVRVYSDTRRRGIAAIGRGLAGRWELSVELDEPGAVRGLGEAIITAALGEAEPGVPLFAQVSPGNARSLRAFLNAGFRPIGSEVLFLVR